MTLILHFGRKINGLVSFLGQSKYSRVLRLSLLPAKYKDSRILRAKYIVNTDFKNIKFLG